MITIISFVWVVFWILSLLFKLGCVGFVVGGIQREGRPVAQMAAIGIRQGWQVFWLSSIFSIGICLLLVHFNLLFVWVLGLELVGWTSSLIMNLWFQHYLEEKAAA